MEKLKYVFLIATLVVFVGCKDDDDNNSVDAPQFMREAASSGMFEVATGRLAAQKASNADVKAFGQQMVTDHSKANSELKTLAAQKSVTLPDTMDAAKQQIYHMLDQKTGADFDKSYMNEMVKAHNTDVAKFQDASNNANDAEVKAWANKTLPTLIMHQEHARTLNGALPNQ